jgi:hypothetical protein
MPRTVPASQIVRTALLSDLGIQASRRNRVHLLRARYW